MKRFWSVLRPALLCFAVLTVICGVIYPAVVTGIAQAVFPAQANGSMVIEQNGDGTETNYGSALISQEFTQPQYLIGRPQGVSNLSPVGEEQAKAVEERTAWLRSLDPGNDAEIPAELVTASGSGVDPNISPAAAEYQVARVARERGMDEDEVRGIIKKNTVGKFLGIFGEEGVNVLKVNLALDGIDTEGNG